MAPGTKGRAAKSSTKASRSLHATTDSADTNIYQSMLSEASSSSPTSVGSEGRTIKKRRVGGKLAVQEGSEVVQPLTSGIEHAHPRRSDPSPLNLLAQQTTYNDSDDSDDSDVGLLVEMIAYLLGLPALFLADESHAD